MPEHRGKNPLICSLLSRRHLYSSPAALLSDPIHNRHWQKLVLINSFGVKISTNAFNDNKFGAFAILRLPPAAVPHGQEDRSDPS